MTSKKDNFDMLKTVMQRIKKNIYILLHKIILFTYQQNWEEWWLRSKTHDEVTNKYQKPPQQKS